ncbi:hypothetical protein EV421DRAFT_1738946 [Armillaria borealis]|uniref:Uncharacterized protein n=1 Tax=Armillaria borealis TaxID=47425 RepID=A0AA39MKQ3_9AGAR|nr:hypothetical protein EV421DRAFT_1738946 [Armillaria borealis]
MTKQMKCKSKKDVDPQTSNFRNSTLDQIAFYGYQSKPASLLQGIHFNSTAPHCLPVLLRNQNQRNIEDPMNLDDEDTIHTILVPNLSMLLGFIFVPDMPMFSPPLDDTITGHLAFTLLPAAGFPAIQGWIKLGTAINLSNMVKHSQEGLRKSKCLIFTITQITDALTNTVQGVTGNDSICLSPPNSPEVLAFLTGNCNALSSSLSPEQAVNYIVKSVGVKKMDLIITGEQKERVWVVYATSPTTMFNIHIAWCNLVRSLPFNADLATYGKGVQYLKDLCLLHTAMRSNNTPTIDFDTLQIMKAKMKPITGKALYKNICRMKRKSILPN